MTDEGVKEASNEVKSLVERIERLEEEKNDIASEIRHIYAEAKSHGFDNQALRALIRLRKLDPEERLQRDQLLATYMRALGMDHGNSMG